MPDDRQNNIIVHFELHTLHICLACLTTRSSNIHKHSQKYAYLCAYKKIHWAYIRTYFLIKTSRKKLSPYFDSFSSCADKIRHRKCVVKCHWCCVHICIFISISCLVQKNIVKESTNRHTVHFINALFPCIAQNLRDKIGTNFDHPLSSHS